MVSDQLHASASLRPEKTPVASKIEPIFIFKTIRKSLVPTGNLTPDQPVHNLVTVTNLSVSAMNVCIFSYAACSPIALWPPHS